MAQDQPGPVSAAEPKELERIGQRITNEADSMQNYVERLERLSDRIQGSMPRDNVKTIPDDAADVPHGQLASMHSNLDRLASISSALANELNRLEDL